MSGIRAIFIVTFFSDDALATGDARRN